jgi:SAM-dependent methyltransferase
VKHDANTQFIEITRALESWYSRPPGEELFATVLARLKPVLDLAFGYHIVQLGPLPGRSLIDESPINHRFYACTCSAVEASMYCHGDELPLESDSVDMLVAFHALEFDERPHGSLREMLRVLRPHGHLVVVGYNPYSLLGISQYLRGWRSSSLWHRHRPVSAHRLTDWLRLLDCELESLQHLYPLPLVGRGRLRSWISGVDNWAAQHNLPGGSLYVAHGIKQIAGIRRPRPVRVRARERIFGLAVSRSPMPKTTAASLPAPARMPTSASTSTSTSTSMSTRTPRRPGSKGNDLAA